MLPRCNYDVVLQLTHAEEIQSCYKMIECPFCMRRVRGFSTNVLRMLPGNIITMQTNLLSADVVDHNDDGLN